MPWMADVIAPVTALTPLLFSTGISVSSTYEKVTRLHNIRSDITFDTVQHSYIHGGPISKSCGDSVAPRTRRTEHRTLTHAGSSHASRRAEHGAFFPCAAVLVELEREPVEGFLPRPAWSPSIGEEAKDSKVDAKKSLSVRQGAARAVSERAPLGYSRQEVCRCAVEDTASAGTEEGERPLGCGEVVRAKALAPSRQG